MIEGGCHCGAVRYRLTGEIGRAMYCHCHTCRKIHGTTHATSGIAPLADFEVTGGENAVVAYESSPGKKRCFCGRCGAHVYAFSETHADVVILRLGTIDGDPGVRPMAHIWMSQKAPWYEVLDDLPRFAEFPDSH